MVAAEADAALAAVLEALACMAELGRLNALEPCSSA